MSEMSYIVVCTPRTPTNEGPPRVVGPFESQDAAVTWAQEHRRRGNAAWDYTPDVMEAPR